MIQALLVSMRKTVGVAQLAFRAAVRTRVVAALLGLLALCVVALPVVVQGDGTPAGQLHIQLTYTLGLAFAILCLATLWAACALFAAEIDTLRIELTAVKPVTRAELWFGKWFALLALDAWMLALVYAGVYAQTALRMHREAWPDSVRPDCHFVTRPELPSPVEEAREMYALLAAKGELPKGVAKRRLLRILAEKAPDRYTILNPGEKVVWSFTLPRPVGKGDTLGLRIAFDTAFRTGRTIAGVCRFRCTDEGASQDEVPLPFDTGNLEPLNFRLDTATFLTSDSGDAPALRHFTCTFHLNGSPKHDSATMLRYRKDVELLTPGGSFLVNYARSAFLQFCTLAALAALGLFLSACFTLPVAAFAGTLLLVLFPVTHSVTLVVSEEDRDTWLNRTGIWISERVTESVNIAVRGNPLDLLTRGERIDRKLLMLSAVWDLAVFPLLFAAAGCLVLRKRELSEAKS